MRLTASKLRKNIYKVLDRVAETGRPVEIVKDGKVLKIVPAESRSPSEGQGAKLDRLERRELVVGDPADLIHLDWSEEWKG